METQSNPDPICECWKCGKAMTCADVDEIPPEEFHEDYPECETCRAKKAAVPVEDKEGCVNKWRECADCGESITIWWTDDEGQVYCAGCFANTGASCGGCAHDDCRLCNEEEDEDECETCGTTTNILHQGNNGIYRGKWCCDTCIAKDDALEDEEEEMERLRRAQAESVARTIRILEARGAVPERITETTIVSGIVCRRCGNELPEMTAGDHLAGRFNQECPHREQGRWTDEKMKRFYEVLHSR